MRLLLATTAAVAMTVLAAAPALADTPYGSFGDGGTMAYARTGHTATLLGDGTILVAGGGDNSMPSTTGTELFNTRSGGWSTTGSMTALRVGHVAVKLDDGRVLVAGGVTASNPPGTSGANNLVFTRLNLAEIYDPPRQAWRPVAPMHGVRYRATATLLADGRVLVAGGGITDTDITASAEVYDPAANRWTSTPPMSTPRGGHSAVLLRSGKVLLISGNASGTEDSTLTTAELYDPTTNSWAAAGETAVGHFQAMAGLLADGRVLVAGGYNVAGGYRPATAGTDLYNPASNSWTPGPPMHAARGAGGGGVLSNGLFLAAGGTGARGGLQPAQTAELFDPALSVWIRLPPLHEGRFGATVTPYSGSGALLAGGNGRDSSEVFTYRVAPAADAVSVTRQGLPTSTWALLVITALLAVAAAGQAAWRRRRPA
jgi:hypothetical protein